MNFAWHSFSQTSDIYLSFGQPMDVVGNPVDLDGHSLDKNQKTIPLEDYFKSGDSINIDAQRESVYTQMLGGEDQRALPQGQYRFS